MFDGTGTTRVDPSGKRTVIERPVSHWTTSALTESSGPVISAFWISWPPIRISLLFPMPGRFGMTTVWPAVVREGSCARADVAARPSREERDGELVSHGVENLTPSVSAGEPSRTTIRFRPSAFA